MIAQLALTLAVISNALFFIQQRVSAISRPTGIAESELFTLYVRGKKPNFDLVKSIQQDMALIRNLPGVINAAPIDRVPLSKSGGGNYITSLPQSDVEINNTAAQVNYFYAGTTVVESLGMRLIDGRDFAADDYQIRDRYDAGVPSMAIITHKAAQELFPNQPLAGKTVYFAGVHPVEVIGVIERCLGSWVNWPHAGNVLFFPGIRIENDAEYIIRTELAHKQRIMSEIKRKLLAIDNQRVILFIRPMEFYKNRAYARDYAMIKILLIVAIALILVGAAGIIGLTTLMVNQRRKQIGILRALGANRLLISRDILAENTFICIVAIAFGSFLARVMSDVLAQRFSTGLLPWYYMVMGAVVLLLVTLIAAWWPARRAAHISPAAATRSA